MTEKQRATVFAIVAALTHNKRAPVGLHGDCLGADEDFNAILTEQGIHRTCRPCTDVRYRAGTDAAILADPVRPMQRNREIVASADAMIACPPNWKRIKSGSGTWATIGFTERAGKMLYIVFPDGTVETSYSANHAAGA